MPRGIPNVKRDDTGMRFTTFNVPAAPNPKHVNSIYLKTDSQSLWARNASRKSKTATVEDSTSPEPRRGTNVIVIHPGSRFLRIGRASDVNPTSIPNVVARKYNPPVPVPTTVQRIFRARPKASVPEDKNDTEDPFKTKIGIISDSLRDRMQFYKLRVTLNTTTIASTFNEQFKPEIIAPHNDPFQVDWIDKTSNAGDVVTGEKALEIADPQKSGYVVRWPIRGSTFNTRDYASLQLVLSDLETIIRNSLKEKFDIDGADLKNYSVVLVIPDIYERTYVREFINILISMGFKQFCAQQESLAAIYGAGISNACVVDIGAAKTSIACVDEGLILPDTRLSLNIGGDDITEFFYVLLERIKFPYREINLARSYDWNVMEDMKARLCTLAEGDVALNLYDFVVRQPGKSTEKYGLRAYDEIILAPMCLFEPRIVDFDSKSLGSRPISPNVTEEIIGHQAEPFTNAMVISTQHMMPTTVGSTPKVIIATTTTTPGASTPKPDRASPPTGDPMQVDQPLEGIREVIEGDDDAKITASILQPIPSQAPATEYPGGFAIDVCFEASKLPLDVAIFNSARAAGGDEKIRKYLQAVLVVGGTALIPGMAHALESRLQAIATPLVANMDKVQILPPPKEVDPRVVVWKGAAVLGKMDGVSELWVTPADWDILGMRGLKERCFYL